MGTTDEQEYVYSQINNVGARMEGVFVSPPCASDWCTNPAGANSVVVKGTYSFG